jgi:hypothetical protein
LKETQVIQLSASKQLYLDLAKERTTRMKEEMEQKGRPVSWTAIVSVALIFVASFYCAEHPDSTLARFIKSFRYRNKSGTST